MAFGKRGTAATSDSGVQSYGLRAAAPGYGEEVRFGHGAGSVAGSIFFILLGAGLLYYIPNNYVLDIKAYFALAAGGLLVIFFSGNLVNAMLGKARLIIDGKGFRSESVFRNAVMAWEDLDHFEVMSVNYTKIVFAYAKKTAGMTSSKKMAVPTDVFKDTSLRFAGAAIQVRPDLAPQLAVVMHKVGAKKLAKDIHA